ncbi:class I SAM-dependent methyltransferase [Streptomyces sp. PAL114]|uniref:class I SAM-dependent methyltransferase n=1 Tax=Streptomyces sp. PAL114 TaxID=2970893 RepID=UPI0028FD1C8E|nr:class I SAM-dependent methyltransferase [Streptomyces sp. PAL114]MDU0301745.1 class I SAM-dependent methyltransferase [Streptomyces sp. PAL114]
MIAQNAHYNEKMASVYEQMYPIGFDTDAAVEFLSGLVAPESRVLELGIGTGRIAVPMAERGFHLHGVDASEAMLAKLAERDEKGQVTARLGDFTRPGLDLGGDFPLVTLVLNTFFVAVSREAQLNCLRNVRDQLAEGGRFVLEAFDPSPYHVLTKPDFSMRYLGTNAVMLDTLMVDRSQQIMVATHTILDGGAPETTQHVLRYAFPLEIDLLAELAGLRLVERWAGWHKEPFTATSPRHVSVYERAEQPEAARAAVPEVKEDTHG